MPAILNWLLRLLPTNPICMRLVQGGSRRIRHMWIRTTYLAVMMLILLFVLAGGSGTTNLRELAQQGANAFKYISYGQVALICLLTPIFMAGAIAQEANPKTWDILLTTPLNGLQIVLGNLFGRLFFILALLFSTLPLFAVTQYFGGVPGEAIFTSYAIAGTSALLVAAVAVTLSVTRTAGRRAVFIFYVAVVLYLAVTAAIDFRLRGWGTAPPWNTTLMTPLNPFLALEALLSTNRYIAHQYTQVEANWLVRAWMNRPIATFCWLCTLISLVLVVFSTARLRIIGAKVGTIPWYRRVLKLGAKGATERPPRKVGHNPIAWREAAAKGKTPSAVLARWGFVVLGVAVAMTLLILYHVGTISGDDLRLGIGATVGAEILIIVLTSLNMSATAVTREREDGTLDLILTTPIQPGPYLAGKLRGLIQYLVPMLSVPVVTMAILAVYVLAGGFGRTGGVLESDMVQATAVDLPVILPVGAITLPLVLVPFVAFCVIIGLMWSVRSKGTIGSVVASVAIILVVAGVLGLCGVASGGEIAYLGAVLNTFSPINLLYAIVSPASAISDSIPTSGVGTVGAAGPAQLSLLIGAGIAAVAYGLLVYGFHSNVKRTFMMTVRRLAGTT